jgi:hypothetical protein
VGYLRDSYDIPILTPHQIYQACIPFPDHRPPMWVAPREQIIIKTIPPPPLKPPW